MNIGEAKAAVRHATHRHAKGEAVGVDQLIDAARVLSSSVRQLYRIKHYKTEWLISANRKPTHDEAREMLGIEGDVEIHDFFLPHWGHLT